ncbi:L-threonylcarbamoyladenylate synthase [Microscilla marina]|uniref:Threonylcarbamoyl-AMP synthase n=1 Tax=Microscilla marina ATCC 23134 TaxID=313606 RepID=A1ZZ21_MICM2|nr:L-threonylcarbamoyladenylate synthase [Microscilla marina]EAY24343.1 translation factor SUA5 [Microscilla marina ATCC 23134]
MDTLIGQNLTQASILLTQGKLVAIPTETVYGLAANAFDKKAVTRIFEAKNRPTFDPLIVHTHSIEQVQQFTKNIPEKAKKLAKQFWPGSLTILLEKNDLIPDLVTAGLSTVAVRIPNHPLTLELLKQLDFPLAAPSANPFGYISPTTAGHVEAQLKNKVSYIIDGGPCQVGIESTIVEVKNNQTTIYRLGGISVENIEAATGKVEEVRHSSSNPKASGMLKSHYAPQKKMIIGDIAALLPQYPCDKVGILSFRKTYEQVPKNQQVVLSAEGELAKAAQGLFAGMRYLDNQPVEIILAELMPEKGLGRAINDRIRRAATES